MASEYFAMYGTEEASHDGTVRVSTSDSQPAKLGPNGTYSLITTAEDHVSPMWKPATNTTAAPGAFTIATDSSFSYPTQRRLCPNS